MAYGPVKEQYFEGLTGTLSTNLPTNTTFLAPQLIRINNTASAVAVDFSTLYIETYV